MYQLGEFDMLDEMSLEPLKLEQLCEHYYVDVEGVRLSEFWNDEVG